MIWIFIAGFFAFPFTGLLIVTVYCVISKD